MPTPQALAVPTDAIRRRRDCVDAKSLNEQLAFWGKPETRKAFGKQAVRHVARLQKLIDDLRVIAPSEYWAQAIAGPKRRLKAFPPGGVAGTRMRKPWPLYEGDVEAQRWTPPQMLTTPHPETGECYSFDAICYRDLGRFARVKGSSLAAGDGYMAGAVHVSELPPEDRRRLNAEDSANLAGSNRRYISLEKKQAKPSVKSGASRHSSR